MANLSLHRRISLHQTVIENFNYLILSNWQSFVSRKSRQIFVRLLFDTMIKSLVAEKCWKKYQRRENTEYHTEAIFDLIAEFLSFCPECRIHLWSCRWKNIPMDAKRKFLGITLEFLSIVNLGSDIFWGEWSLQSVLICWQVNKYLLWNWRGARHIHPVQ